MGAVANIMVGRPVRPSAIKSLAPATVISFAVAAVAFWITARSKGQPEASHIWRLAPLLIAPVTQIIYSRTEDEQALKNDKKGFLDINNGDMPSLKALYSVLTAAAGAAHLVMIVLPWLTGSNTLTQVTSFLKARETFVLAGSLVGGTITSIVSTRLQGYTTTWGALRAGLVSMGLLPIFGPAAVFAGAHYWKEVTTAKYCFWKHEKDNTKA